MSSKNHIYYIPKLGDDNMIASSVYTTIKCSEHLDFLLHHCIQFVNEEECCIPYELLEKKWDNWKDAFRYLFDISFPVYIDGTLSQIHWIEQMSFDNDKRLFHYRFTKQVRDNISRIYYKYPKEYDGVICIKRMYTYQIFEFLKEKYGDASFCEAFEIQTLRNVCNISDEIYRKDTEFKRTILGKAVQDINDLFGWKLSVRTIEKHYEFCRR